jgi:hypothetical protein
VTAVKSGPLGRTNQVALWLIGRGDNPTAVAADITDDKGLPVADVRCWPQFDGPLLETRVEWKAWGAVTPARFGEFLAALEDTADFVEELDDLVAQGHTAQEIFDALKVGPQ